MATDGFAGTATSSTAAGLEAILLQVGIIGVTGAGVEVGFGVVMRPLVLVLHEETDRCAE